MPLRIAVLGSGRGSNLRSLLAHIEAGHVDARVGLVISDRPGAPILEHAQRAGVPAVATVPRDGTRQQQDRAIASLLRDEMPDLVVLAGYMRILGAEALSACPGRVVNIHPSLLPAYPGARAVRDALAGGARLTGCTTHIVTDDLDGGPIILQAALAIRPTDDEARLTDRILRLEHLLLPRTVQLFAEDRIRSGPEGLWIAAGDSWLHDPAIEPVAGAIYSEGF